MGHGPPGAPLRGLGCASRLGWFALALMVADGLAGPVRASSNSDGNSDPDGRGIQLLDARAGILQTQSRQAAVHARTRGLLLYRLLEARARARRGEDTAGDDLAGGQAVALATAVLVRDLREARTLHQELERVLAERSGVLQPQPPQSLQQLAEGQQAAVSTAVRSPGGDGDGPRAPRTMLRPVAGPLVTPFGVARDPGTGAWLFRSAASFQARPFESVRAPLSARVAAISESVAGGMAVVLDSGDGWTVILDGLDTVSVVAGQIVARGARLATSGDGRTASVRPVRIEVWRGRTPVDPAELLLRSRPSTTTSW